jgi:6-pyruvoyltetrahydropterin/6-carboxytetrahydropterin synthase
MQEASYKILHLSKENFKFSVAHFLIFDEKTAERLHGHNYQVKVDLKIDWQKFAEQGYGVDFGALKTIIKGCLDALDEHVVLPANNKEIKVKTEGSSLELRFRERRYVFPADEVILLPLVNTSVELLSDYLCQEIWKNVVPLGIVGLGVQVEETRGQSATTRLGLW